MGGVGGHCQEGGVEQTAAVISRKYREKEVRMQPLALAANLLLLLVVAAIGAVSGLKIGCRLQL